jgi:hypothetical protein
VLIHRKLKDFQPVGWKKGSAAAEVIFNGGQISPAYRWLYARITYYKVENLFPGKF